MSMCVYEKSGEVEVDMYRINDKFTEAVHKIWSAIKQCNGDKMIAFISRHISTGGPKQSCI